MGPEPLGRLKNLKILITFDLICEALGLVTTPSTFPFISWLTIFFSSIYKRLHTMMEGYKIKRLVVEPPWHSWTLISVLPSFTHLTNSALATTPPYNSILNPFIFWYFWVIKVISFGYRMVNSTIKYIKIIIVSEFLLGKSHWR